MPATLPHIALGLWLMSVCTFAMISPTTTLRLIGKFGSTPLIHFGEQGARILLGVIFVLTAPLGPHPIFFKFFGAFLALSGLALAVLPRSIHRDFAQFWAQKIPSAALRVFAGLGFLAGAYLAYASTIGLN